MIADMLNAYKGLQIKHDQYLGKKLNLGEMDSILHSFYRTVEHY
jgi:hypothetical protein